MLNLLKGLSAVVAACLLTFSAAAQVLEKFELGDACNYFGEETPAHVHTFASSKEAEDMIMQILETIGLPQNFDIVSAGVPNAAAVIHGDKRFILYSRYFMNNIKKHASNQWAPISIMAHEIGHHLAGHTLKSDGSRPLIELEADRFSGSVLQKMGASLEDALAAMEQLGNEHGSATHPRKLDRLEAITAGWEDSCAKDINCQATRNALEERRWRQQQQQQLEEEEYRQAEERYRQQLAEERARQEHERNNPAIVWTVSDACNDGKNIQYRFFAYQNEQLVALWPDNDKAYVTMGGSETHILPCNAARYDIICYGAQPDDGDGWWGVVFTIARNVKIVAKNVPCPGMFSAR